jgi:hypothetical protein
MARNSPRAAALVLAACLLATSCVGPRDADCSKVTIDGVMAAVGAVEGYTYRVEGTDGIADTVFADRTISYEYGTAAVRGEGAYRAPDRARVTFEEGMLEPPPRRSSVFGSFWPPDVDDYVRIGDAMWFHARGEDHHYPAHASVVFAANTLDGLLGGVPYRLHQPGRAPDSSSWAQWMAWSVMPQGPSCRVRGELNLPFAPPPSVSRLPTLVVVATVDPSSLLPAQVRITSDFPWSKLGRPQEWDVRFELTYTFAYQPLPEIEEPANVGPPPTSNGEATPPPG